ncbi:hypothetical protein ABZT02_41350 [Streptomyces sp. NPDC005402]|uniref:hypothetical protein n=1 Tax=Streptomyces sp. NPDC005402 TaxID=3155338 RepID=UPI0033A8046E
MRKLAKDAETCLNVVGMTVADLEQTAAAEFSEGSAYLVGSWPQGSETPAAMLISISCAGGSPKRPGRLCTSSGM